MLAMAIIQSIVFILLTPWAYRNHEICGRWIFTSTATGWTLVGGLGYTTIHGELKGRTNIGSSKQKNKESLRLAVRRGISIFESVLGSGEKQTFGLRDYSGKKDTPCHCRSADFRIQKSP